MKEFDSKKILKRYQFITWLFVVVGILIILSAIRIMTIEKNKWVQLSNTLEKDSVVLKPVRGSILSCDGEVLANSMPRYKIYMDFMVGDPKDIKKRDSLWAANIDKICIGLNRIFPSESADSFKFRFAKARKADLRHWEIWHERIDYNTLKAVMKLPILCLSSNKGGFHYEVFNARNHPFQTLASRTIGDLYAGKDSARFGIELSYDSLLRGIDGYSKRRKVMDRFLDIIDVPATAGADIVTTIDVNMQDVAEKAVEDKLIELNANIGIAILMECKTGDVKAIVNLAKGPDGRYREDKNYAVSSLYEPGSVFKTASFMVALDDAVCDTNEVVDTGCGIVDMYGAKMKDHNWHRGGYGTMRLPRALEVSSNVGVSKIIDKYYGKNPQKFIDGLHRIGIAEDLHLPIPGYGAPVIKGPKERKEYWSKTALPWMSIGYETGVPPISTVTFYNAIANNGKMMRPRFVSKIIKDGIVVKEFEPEVIKSQICNQKTLKEIQTILAHVVSQGLGNKAGSKLFPVAGKTGTAQISQGAMGYKGNGVNYLLSFAGFFPADNPMYSCIVCIQKSGLPASGGGMAGPVFRKIAEGVMAKNLKRDIEDAKDTVNILPDVKSGNMLLAKPILAQFGIRMKTDWGAPSDSRQIVWGTASETDKRICLQKNTETNSQKIPDVRGMGARDAIYALESRGVKAKLTGRGRVKAQSHAAGTTITKGMVCQLNLE